MVKARATALALVMTNYLLAGAFAAGFAGAVAAGLAGAFAAGLVFAGAAFALAGAVLPLAASGVLVFAATGVAAPAGRAPLNSLGLSTTFLAKKFSILASFIAIA